MNDVQLKELGRRNNWEKLLDTNQDVFVLMKLVLGIIPILLLGLFISCDDDILDVVKVSDITMIAKVAGKVFAEGSELPNNAVVNITLTTETTGTELYYTLDGSDPTKADGTEYTGDFTIKTNDPFGETITLKAVAVKDGFSNSAILAQEFVFGADMELIWDGEIPLEKPDNMKDVENGVQEINTVYEFVWIMSQENMFAGGVKTIKLMTDINLNNESWTPSQAPGVMGPNNTFDGNNHTIFNLKVTEGIKQGDTYLTGMFVSVSWDDTTIKNLTIDGAEISAANAGVNERVRAAVLVAGLDNTGEFINIKIKNAVVVGTKYVGGIASYSTDYGRNTLDKFKDNTIENVELRVQEISKSGGSVDLPHIGGLVGLMNKGNISGNTITQTPISGQEASLNQVGVLCGTAQVNVTTIEDNEVTNVSHNGENFTKLVGLDNRQQ